MDYLRELVVRDPRNEGLRGVLAECEAELGQYGQGWYGVGADGQQYGALVPGAQV